MRVFISYSHRDAASLERLHVHLATLLREGRIHTWFDREILGGDNIDDEIKRELEAAGLFLLLISPDFIASDYCVEQEMRRALERHDAGSARVVPIILQPCDWASIPSLRRLKALPKDGNPISEWANANTAFLDVVQELRRILNVEEPKTATTTPPKDLLTSAQPSISRYRVQRDFDDIDRGQFRDIAFAAIRDYFRRAIQEISEIEGLRGRFIDLGATAFGSTVINRGRQYGTAHITVHCGKGKYSLGDIYFSFSENAKENTANGGFNVASDEYDQFLTVTMHMFGRNVERLNPDQAAEYLWSQFIEKAGITNA